MTTLPGASGLFDLSGKVAVVTGASRGIGRAIALRLAQHGALVTVSSRKLDACEAVVADIAAAGGRARAQACHIGRKEDLAALVARTVEAWGGIDILVCNAAINPHFGPAATVSDDAFDRTMASNVRSNFWLANMVLPGMAARGGGSIIVVSSIAGLRGSTNLGIYALSKAADLQLVRNIAVEWGASAPTPSPRAWCAPISPARSGRIPSTSPNASAKPRSSASASPTKSPVPPSSSPPQPRAS
jgi:NAD(P)-dependent dehydrogenase (short-subunit alcohol dehydrogenase family)